MKKVIAQLTSKKVEKKIDMIRPVFKELPHLPKGLTDFLVSIAPWLAGIGGVLGVLSGIGMLGDSTSVRDNWILELTNVSPMYFAVVGVLQIIGGVILLLAFKPLKDRNRTGWILLFWNMVVSILQSLAAVGFGYSVGGSLMGMVVGLAIGLYILFEMEKSYK